MISFVFPQEKKSAKINIFASVVQPQEKYEHIGEEINMMDLLVDVCVYWYAFCVFKLCSFMFCFVFDYFKWCIVFLLMLV